MAPLLPDLLAGALDLVFAPTCVACGGPIPTTRADRGVCLPCWARARPLPAPRCERCWTPRPLATAGVLPECRECPGLRPAMRAVRSAFLLNEPVRGILHALKYRGWHALAEPMAARMSALPWPREVEEEVELLIPVPLTPARARQRGYNQAELLAASLARKTGRQCDGTLLQRRRSVRSQTTLHPDERRANVAGAFQVRPHGAARLAGEHVLLVDDVWTTGATALACAEALLNAGARAVSVSTFARAIPELERQRRRVGSAATSA